MEKRPTETTYNDYGITEFEGRSYARGIGAGLCGAFALMAFIGVADLLRGEMFYTPSLFGSLLFRGEYVLGANFELAFAYSLVHLGLFTGLGITMARVMQTDLRSYGRGRNLFAGLALALFGGMTLFLAGVAIFVAPALFADLGTVSLLIGNAIAAVVMSGVLVATKRPRPYSVKYRNG